MGSFFSWLTERIRQTDSLLCVGLDPHLDDLPEPTAEAAVEFCLRLIRATAEQAACFKPNSAFFEVFGAAGVNALRQVIASVPEGVPVILDAKRGDIPSTAEAYARAAFEALGAHAVTVSPYLGYDSIEPFLQAPERGVFLLAKPPTLDQPICKTRGWRQAWRRGKLFMKKWRGWRRAGIDVTTWVWWLERLNPRRWRERARLPPIYGYSPQGWALRAAIWKRL